MLDLVLMDVTDKLMRQFEECTEQIVHLRHQIAYLDGVRNDIRKKIRALSRGESPIGKPGSPALLVPVRSVGSAALRETAAAVEGLGEQVNAERLSQALKITPDAARLRLARAAKEGLIVRTTLGHYRAPDRTQASVPRGINPAQSEEDIPLGEPPYDEEPSEPPQEYLDGFEEER